MSWFSLLSRRTIQHGVFKSAAALREAIMRFLDAWNEHHQPFAWVESGEQMLARANRQRFTVTWQ